MSSVCLGYLSQVRHAKCSSQLWDDAAGLHQGREFSKVSGLHMRRTIFCGIDGNCASTGCSFCAMKSMRLLPCTLILIYYAPGLCVKACVCLVRALLASAVLVCACACCAQLSERRGLTQSLKCALLQPCGMSLSLSSKLCMFHR